jgi:hypothetical protein
MSNPQNMLPALENMQLTELFDLLAIKTGELLKAIDRRNKMDNVKELKVEVEKIQAAIMNKKLSSTAA